MLELKTWTIKENFFTNFCISSTSGITIFNHYTKCNETLQQPKVFNYKERHAYIHKIRSKYSPAGASTNTHAYIDTKIYYVIRYTMHINHYFETLRALADRH